MKNSEDTERLLRAAIKAAGGQVLRSTSKGHLLVLGPLGTATIGCHKVHQGRGYINGVKQLERIGLRLRRPRGGH